MVGAGEGKVSRLVRLEDKLAALAGTHGDLAAGKDYINIHTAANKGGEIRGQLGP